MKKNILHLLLTILTVSTSYGQGEVDADTTANYTAKVAQAVLSERDDIANFNQVQNRYVGFAGSPSKQYKSYSRLIQIASDDDLYQLTNDTNYVVATYATFGLIERENTLFVKVFEKFLQNDQSVTTMKGCTVSDNAVSSEIYYEYWNKVNYESKDDKDALQNDPILYLMDSLILVTKDANWRLKERVYSNRVYSGKDLFIIEQNAFDKGNMYAIEYLFNHHLNDYKERITRALLKYLDKENTILAYYDKTYRMLLSFRNTKVNQVLVKELNDIKLKHGEENVMRYKVLLQKKNIVVPE